MLAHEIRARVARGEVSPLEVAQAYLKRVQELDPGLGAFLSLNERLLEEAEAVDPGLPLAGLVVAVKDNIHTTNMPTTETPANSTINVVARCWLSNCPPYSMK